MLLADIYAQFANCKSWEDRYRLLIQFSRQIEKPTPEQLSSWQEIHGCESRLWCYFQYSPRQIYAYSEARLMQGLLAIVITALQEQTTEQLRQFQIQTLLDDLHITRHLTLTRLNGLKQLEQIVKNAIND